METSLIILSKLSDIEDRLSKIEERLKITENGSLKMTNHIDFIENVYSSLKSPLEYMRWKLGFSEETNLPQIKNTEGE